MRRPSSCRRSSSHVRDRSTPRAGGKARTGPHQNRNAADLSAASLSFWTLTCNWSDGLNLVGWFIVRARCPDVRRESRGDLGRMSPKDHDPDWLVLLRVRGLLHMISAERRVSPERARTRAPKAPWMPESKQISARCNTTTYAAESRAGLIVSVPLTRLKESQSVSFRNDQAIALRAMNVLAAPSSTVTSQPWYRRRSSSSETGVRFPAAIVCTRCTPPSSVALCRI